jgi:bisphosphoglycerate-independent phosphoglycerate mutase (AlkP superfamily)/enoyl-CoA hydratase/carnithine racemase
LAGADIKTMPVQDVRRAKVHELQRLKQRLALRQFIVLSPRLNFMPDVDVSVRQVLRDFADWKIVTTEEATRRLVGNPAQPTLPAPIAAQMVQLIASRRQTPRHHSPVVSGGSATARLIRFLGPPAVQAVLLQYEGAEAVRQLETSVGLSPEAAEQLVGEVARLGTPGRAQALAAIMSMDEGPAIEPAMYHYATHPASGAPVRDVQGWEEALRWFYQAGGEDQFIPPLVLVDENGKPLGLVKDGDTVLYWDFRTDRAKPLSGAFLNVPYDGQVGGLSDRAQVRPKVRLITMTHYDDRFTSQELPPEQRALEAFNPAAPIEDTYAEVAGRAGIRQLVVSESEKWRAVTWFKDGRRNLGYVTVAEDDATVTQQHPDLPITVKIVKSRKVGSHIQAPQMRAKEIGAALRAGVDDGIEDIFVNIPNADMVGHAQANAAQFDAVVQGIQEIDTVLGDVVPHALSKGNIVILFADHGNGEQMLHEDGAANPAHTSNPVPFIVLGLDKDEQVTVRPDVTIGDLAPTVMALRGITPPSSWDRQSALVGTLKPRKDRKIIKICLDGYGLRQEREGNAMAAAAERKGSPLHIDRWMAGEDGAIAAPANASGEANGYPEGTAGTTEFGHVLFDAGRRVGTDQVAIDLAIEKGEFDENAVLLEDIRRHKAEGTTLHLMGILSDGRVHSSLAHVEAILRLAAKEGLRGDQVVIHVITDGRDVRSDSAPQYLAWLAERMATYRVGRIGSIWGRGWGKDRDNRWLRIEAAYRSLVEGTAAMHVRLPKPVFTPEPEITPAAALQKAVDTILAHPLIHGLPADVGHKRVEALADREHVVIRAQDDSGNSVLFSLSVKPGEGYQVQRAHWFGRTPYEVVASGQFVDTVERTVTQPDKLDEAIQALLVDLPQVFAWQPPTTTPLPSRQAEFMQHLLDYLERVQPFGDTAWPQIWKTVDVAGLANPHDLDVQAVEAFLISTGVFVRVPPIPDQIVGLSEAEMKSLTAPPGVLFFNATVQVEGEYAARLASVVQLGAAWSRQAEILTPLAQLAAEREKRSAEWQQRPVDASRYVAMRSAKAQLIEILQQESELLRPARERNTTVRAELEAQQPVNQAALDAVLEEEGRLTAQAKANEAMAGELIQADPSLQGVLGYDKALAPADSRAPVEDKELIDVFQRLARRLKQLEAAEEGASLTFQPEAAGGLVTLVGDAARSLDDEMNAVFALARTTSDPEAILLAHVSSDPEGLVDFDSAIVPFVGEIETGGQKRLELKLAVGGPLYARLQKAARAQEVVQGLDDAIRQLAVQHPQMAGLIDRQDVKNVLLSVWYDPESSWSRDGIIAQLLNLPLNLEDASFRIHPDELHGIVEALMSGRASADLHARDLTATIDRLAARYPRLDAFFKRADVKDGLLSFWYEPSQSSQEALTAMLLDRAQAPLLVASAIDPNQVEAFIDALIAARPNAGERGIANEQVDRPAVEEAIVDLVRSIAEITYLSKREGVGITIQEPAAGQPGVITITRPAMYLASLRAKELAQRAAAIDLRAEVDKEELGTDRLVSYLYPEGKLFARLQATIRQAEAYVQAADAQDAAARSAASVGETERFAALPSVANGSLEVVRVASDIRQVTVNRQQVIPVNGVDEQTRRDLLAILQATQEDADVQGLIVTGAGSMAFIAGGDTQELLGQTPEQAAENIKLGQQLADAIENSDKPVVMAINGVAAGGGAQLALAAQGRVIAEDGIIWHTELRNGLLPPWGGLHRLPRRVGPKNAVRLLMQPAEDLPYQIRRISAQEALALGYVDVVVPSNLLQLRAVRRVRELAAQGPEQWRVRDAMTETLQEQEATGLFEDRDVHTWLAAQDAEGRGELARQMISLIQTSYTTGAHTVDLQVRDLMRTSGLSELARRSMEEVLTSEPNRNYLRARLIRQGRGTIQETWSSLETPFSRVLSELWAAAVEQAHSEGAALARVRVQAQAQPTNRELTDWMDPEAWQRVLTPLLISALHFSPREPLQARDILIETFAEDGQDVVRITATGSGVTSLERILVEQHGGVVTVLGESNQTIFTIKFPAPAFELAPMERFRNTPLGLVPEAVAAARETEGAP